MEAASPSGPVGGRSILILRFFGGRHLFLGRNFAPSIESSKLRKLRPLPRVALVGGVSSAGGISSLLGLLEWEASLPPSAYSNERYVSLLRILRSGASLPPPVSSVGGISSPFTSSAFPQTFELSELRSAVRKFDQPLKRSAPPKFRNF